MPAGKHLHPKRTVRGPVEDFDLQQLAADKLGLRWAQFARQALNDAARTVMATPCRVSLKHIEQLQPGDRVFLVAPDGRHTECRVAHVMPDGPRVVQEVGKDSAHVIPHDEFEVWA